MLTRINLTAQTTNPTVHHMDNAAAQPIALISSVSAFVITVGR
jgi:hypothetical protein